MQKSTPCPPGPEGRGRRADPPQLILKGGFYSEGADTFVISSNRWTLSFSWAWILKLWDNKGLKSCHVLVQNVAQKAQLRLHFTIWAFRATSNSYLTWFEFFGFKNQAEENKKVHLLKEMTNASVPSEKKPPLGIRINHIPTRVKAEY